MSVTVIPSARRPTGSSWVTSARRRAGERAPAESRPGAEVPILTVTVQISLTGTELPAVVARALTDIKEWAARLENTTVAGGATVTVTPAAGHSSVEDPAQARTQLVAVSELDGLDHDGPESDAFVARAPMDRASTDDISEDDRCGYDRLEHDMTARVTNQKGLRIQPVSRTVLRDGQPVRLTRREFDLLLFLCENPRRVFNRDQLLTRVWGYDWIGGSRTVDVHIRRLRLKLGQNGPLVCTLHGMGYRLDDDVRVAIEYEPE